MAQLSRFQAGREVDYESHAVALDRNELGALLVAAGRLGAGRCGSPGVRGVLPG